MLKIMQITEWMLPACSGQWSVLVKKFLSLSCRPAFNSKFAPSMSGSSKTHEVTEVERSLDSLGFSAQSSDFPFGG